MLERQFTHCMLRPEDISPSSDQLKIVGAFNPGVAKFKNKTMLLVRVAEAPAEQREGFAPSPRMDREHGLVIDWFPQEEHDASDPRVYTHRVHGTIRLAFISHLRVFTSSDGKTIDDPDGRIIQPEGEYEEFGIEDPRITKIRDTWYITYVSVSGHGVTTSLMSTQDFQTFTRHGIIFCPDNKDVLLFPEKVGDHYVAMHRPMPMMKFTIPQIWIAHSPDLLNWGSHKQLEMDGAAWIRDRAGGGTPPIKTPRGWLTIYHGSNKAPAAGGAGVYSAGVMLLDKSCPEKVIARSIEPIMQPSEPFEKRGFLDTVIFPTGMIEHDGMFYVYYGAADDCVGVTAFKRQDMLDALE